MANVATMATDAPDVRTTRRVEAQNILRRACVLVLSCGFLGNARKADFDATVKAATGDQDASVNKEIKKQTRVTKHLVDSKVLSKANSIAAAAKAYLRSKAIPAHRVFGERAYLVPLEAVEEVDAALERFAADLMIEVEKLADEWDAAVDAQELALGPLFKRSDYPSRDEVKRRYSIDWSYVNFGAPERLEHVSHAIFERTQRKFEGQMADAFAETKLVLRQMLLKLTEKIRERLEPDVDGKPKVFRDTILDGLTEFLSTFNVRNISDDAEMARVVETLKNLTHGVDPQMLRDADALREQVFKGIADAATQLDSMIETGRRGIAFGSL